MTRFVPVRASSLNRLSGAPFLQKAMFHEPADWGKPMENDGLGSFRRNGLLEIAHLIHGGLDDENTDIVALVIDRVDEEARTVGLVAKG